MLLSEAKLREKFYNKNRIDSSKKRVPKKRLKVMYLDEKAKSEGVKASANIQRGSARKVTRVLKLIRGKSVNEALAILKFTPKRAARLIEKVLLSACANAENLKNLDRENLYVKRAYAEQGPTLPRIRPMSMGRAGRIRKRTCSTYIILAEKPTPKVKAKNTTSQENQNNTTEENKN